MASWSLLLFTQFGCDYLNRTSSMKSDLGLCLHFTYFKPFESSHLCRDWKAHLTARILSGWDQKLVIRAKTICLHQDKPQSSDSGLPNTGPARSWLQRNSGPCWAAEAVSFLIADCPDYRNDLERCGRGSCKYGQADVLNRKNNV